MGKYGEAAVLAVHKYKETKTPNPDDAWKSAVKKIFPSSLDQQNKGCPKGAFLELCSEGLISDIPSGSYSRSEKNKEYAIKAVSILKSNRFLASQPESQG